MEENKPKRIINSNIKVCNCKSSAMGVEPEIIEEVLNNEIGRQGNELAYYYHSDHLGSASYITDDSGAVTQTLNYLPYGEDWVDLQYLDLMPAENNLGVYKFNGKEKDAESGYNYYGARYYDSEKLSWISVDPMSDKYLNLSPYVYCADNPVVLVDPNGEEMDDYKLNTETGSLTLTKKTNDNFDLICVDKGYSTLKVSKGILKGKKVGDDISKMGFVANNGRQVEGLDLMNFVAFNCNMELSAWGYDDNQGKPCLDVDPWYGNSFHNGIVYNSQSGAFDSKGTRKFHVHIHPGSKNGKGGTGIPSSTDYKMASKIQSNYYIISKRDGLIQYVPDKNSAKIGEGKYYKPINYIPKSLKKYR